MAIFAAAFAVLSQLLLAVAAETSWPQVRDPVFGSRWKLLMARIAEQPHRPLVLMFGSSRVETGWQPDAVNSPDDGPLAFNFGLTGAATSREWLAFRRVIDAGIRPRVVLIEIMPALFSDWRPIEESLVAGKLAAADIADLAPYAHRPDRLWSDWCQARAATAYTSRFVLTSLFVPNWRPIASRTDYLWTGLDRWGAGRLPPTVATPEARQAGVARARDEYAHRLNTFSPPPGPLGLLYRWLDDCRHLDIAAAIVFMPEGPSFQQLYPADSRARLEAFIEHLRATAGVPVIDARNWLPESVMYDGHHLLPAGAAQFSARLANELRPLLTPDP